MLNDETIEVIKGLKKLQYDVSKKLSKCKNTDTLVCEKIQTKIDCLRKAIIIIERYGNITELLKQSMYLIKEMVNEHDDN